MRLPWVLWCAVWAWAWSELPCAVWVQAAGTFANECELYGSQTATETASPLMQFQRRVVIGLLHLKDLWMGQIVLQSSSSGNTCQLFTFTKILTIECANNSLKDVDKFDLSVGDETELWVEVHRGAGGTDVPTWDLMVVQRRGKHRTHFFIPDTKLQPPIALSWSLSQDIQYYYNCVTGCLFRESVQLPKGDHTFFLRHDEDFTQMTVDCSSDNLHDQRVLSINVTAEDLGATVGLREITVIWVPSLGSVGVLVDRSHAGNVTHMLLDKSRQVNVTVNGGGGGLVAACDPSFQKVAGGDSDAMTSEPSTVSTPASSITTGPPSSTRDSNNTNHHHDDHTKPWLSATFILVLLNFITTLAAVIFLTFIFFRSSAETSEFSKEDSGVLATFSRRLSNRSSTRSQHRGSQRRNKDQAEAPRPGQEKADRSSSGDTRGPSETATTPLTTPEPQAGQRQKVLSTNALVKLDFM